MIFVGIDWAEAHHDVCVLDEQGGTLDGFRIPKDWRGSANSTVVSVTSSRNPTR